jgi:hypothetical protein
MTECRFRRPPLETVSRQALPNTSVPFTKLDRSYDLNKISDTNHLCVRIGLIIEKQFKRPVREMDELICTCTDPAQIVLS